MKSSITLFGLSGLFLLLAAALAAPERPEVGFDRDVRPILADNCFACHGFDSNKRQAGLRLDNSEGAYAVLASGHRAIAPGNFQGSALVQRITSRTMPPPASGKKLTDRQIGILRAWVQ